MIRDSFLASEARKSSCAALNLWKRPFTGSTSAESVPSTCSSHARCTVSKNDRTFATDASSSSFT